MAAVCDPAMKTHAVHVLLFALLTGLLIAITACGGKGSAPGVTTPAASQHAQAATPATPTAAGSAPATAAPVRCPALADPTGGDPNRPGTAAYISSHPRVFHLQVSGLLSGAWDCALIVRCGEGPGGWRLQALDPLPLSDYHPQLALSLSSYTGPGTYGTAGSLGGSLLLPQPGSAIRIFRLAPGATLTVAADGKSGSLDGRFSLGDDEIAVWGTFSCLEAAARG